MWDFSPMLTQYFLYFLIHVWWSEFIHAVILLHQCQLLFLSKASNVVIKQKKIKYKKVKWTNRFLPVCLQFKDSIKLIPPHYHRYESGLIKHTEVRITCCLTELKVLGWAMFFSSILRHEYQVQLQRVIISKNLGYIQEKVSTQNSITHFQT